MLGTLLMSYPQHIFMLNEEKLQYFLDEKKHTLTLLLSTPCPVLANSAEQDQLASSEAN